jgi:hypothetical protein
VLSGVVSNVIAGYIVVLLLAAARVLPWKPVFGSLALASAFPAVFLVGGGLGAWLDKPSYSQRKSDVFGTACVVLGLAAAALLFWLGIILLS